VCISIVFMVSQSFGSSQFGLILFMVFCFGSRKVRKEYSCAKFAKALFLILQTLRFRLRSLRETISNLTDYKD
jgi:hypothetical protein